MNEERKIEKILSLANEIRKYHLSEKDVARIVKRIEKKFGNFSMPCDMSNYSDHADESILDELNNLAHQGVCTKEVILKMATIANNLHPERITAYKKQKFCIYCALGFSAVIAVVSIIAAITGKQNNADRISMECEIAKNALQNCEFNHSSDGSLPEIKVSFDNIPAEIIYKEGESVIGVVDCENSDVV